MGQTIVYVLISTVICIAYFTAGRSLSDGYRKDWIIGICSASNSRGESFRSVRA